MSVPIIDRGETLLTLRTSQNGALVVARMASRMFPVWPLVRCHALVGTRALTSGLTSSLPDNRSQYSQGLSVFFGTGEAETVGTLEVDNCY